MVARPRRGGGSRVRRTRDDHLKWSSRVIGAQPDRERGSASSPQNHSALRGALHAIAAATAMRERARERARFHQTAQ